MDNLTPTQQATLDEMGMAEKIAILLIQLGEDTKVQYFQV